MSAPKRAASAAADAEWCALPEPERVKHLSVPKRAAAADAERCAMPAPKRVKRGVGMPVWMRDEATRGFLDTNDWYLCRVSDMSYNWKHGPEEHRNIVVMNAIGREPPLVPSSIVFRIG